MRADESNALVKTPLPYLHYFRRQRQNVKNDLFHQLKGHQLTWDLTIRYQWPAEHLPAPAPSVSLAFVPAVLLQSSRANGGL